MLFGVYYVDIIYTTTIAQKIDKGWIRRKVLYATIVKWYSTIPL